MLRDLEAFAKVIGGKIHGAGEGAVTGVSIDTRTLNTGDVFFALKGERDGHDFLEQARIKGACGAVVSSYHHDVHLAQVVVDDTLAALQLLAKKRVTELDIPVITVTGSNGKTTTKDMIAAVLSTKFRTLKTQGNFNNEIGLPLTLLQLDESKQVAVVEMAMRGRHQISHLTTIAPPDIGVITNIGTTHLELLGSIENIAAAKGELLTGLSPTGTAVLNGDDAWCRRLAADFAGEKIYFGLEAGNDFTAVDIKLRGWHTEFRVPALDDVQFKLPLPGIHNVRNALAALAVGSLMGVPAKLLSRGIANVSLSSMRLETMPGINGSKIINDAYNANPESTIASLQILKEIAHGRSIAVLGDMFELGAYAEEGHRQVGAKVAELALDHLFTVGDLARFIAHEAAIAGMAKEQIHQFADVQAALAAVADVVKKNDLVLVKGSRGMKMETVALGLKTGGG